MAKLVYGLNQSLDGYVDHLAFRQNLGLFRHMYEVMRYWDEDCAAAWWSKPKWVASRSLKSAGPNATLVGDGMEAVIRGLKAQWGGEDVIRLTYVPA